MKKLIFVAICAIFAINANAQFKFKSLDNYDGKTTIVIVNDNFKSESEICCAKFNNDGKTYYNRENETCNFPKRNEQNFSFFASFFLLVFRPLKHQLNAD